MSAPKSHGDGGHVLRESSSSVEDDVPKDYSGLVSDDLREKDETELELEKLIFGDSAGFHGQDFSSTYSREVEAEDEGDRVVSGGGEEEAEEGLETVGDADVCPFLSYELLNC